MSRAKPETPTRPLETRNDAVLARYGTYCVATAASLPHLDAAPFGLGLRWHIDPLKVASGTFLDLLKRLDALTFGPEGMPMDKWVFYDCAELPGFIWGFGTPASDLTSHEREVFGIPAGYEGPVPLSMYIAIPMHEPGAWFGHNLASLNRTFPERSLGGLGRITKAIALKAFRTRRFVGATQWTSTALFIHTRFGPLDLETTWTPAHSIHQTLTYAFDVTDDSLRAAAGDPGVRLERPEPTLWLGDEDEESMQAMQAEIEAGARYVLTGPPHSEGGHLRHPIARGEGD